MTNDVIEVKGYFAGCSTKGNFDIELKFKFTETELANSMELLTGIGRRMKIVAIIRGYDEGDTKVPLGSFMFYDYKVDKDANSIVRFKSTIENCIYNNFKNLMVDEEMEFTLKVKIEEEM